MPIPHPERRNYIRLDTILPILIQAIPVNKDDQPLKFQAYTNNISMTGLCIELDHIDDTTLQHFTQTGKEFNITVKLPLHRHIAAQGSVMWEKTITDDANEQKLLLGIHYTSVDPKDQKRLLSYARYRRMVPKLIACEIILLFLTIGSLLLYGKRVETHSNIIQKDLRKTIEAKNLLYAQLHVLKKEREFQQSYLNQRILQTDILTSRLSEISAKRVPDKESGIVYAYEFEKTKGLLKEAQKEISMLKNYLKVLKEDKETLEAKLIAYESIGEPALKDLVLHSSQIKGELQDISLRDSVELTKNLTADIQTPAACIPTVLDRSIVLSMALPQDQVVFNDNNTGCALGAFIEDSIGENSMNTFERIVGKKCAFFMWFQDWSTPFPSNQCTVVTQSGKIPVITWEPTYWSGKEISYDDILSSRYDSYIQKWAQEAVSWGQPMLLRFAHEFNGNWYPWSLVRNGKKPERFIAVYQKIVSIFRLQGAKNVKFIWCFNNDSIPNEEWNNPLKSYPGDDFVDWIGIDGYNWGFGDTWSQWKTFKGVFFPAYMHVTAAIADKPIMISETGSAEVGGNKAGWLKDLPENLKEMPRIKALCWFNSAKERNWCIESSKESILSAQKAFRDPYFSSKIISFRKKK